MGSLLVQHFKMCIIICVSIAAGKRNSDVYKVLIIECSFDRVFFVYMSKSNSIAKYPFALVKYFIFCAKLCVRKPNPVYREKTELATTSNTLTLDFKGLIFIG